MLSGCTLLGCNGDASTSVDGSLQRPEPPSSLDEPARAVIRENADMVAKNPRSAAYLMSYGDTCLMNLWPEEARFAYETALDGSRSLPPELAGYVRWRLAEALHRLGDAEAADREAVAALEEIEQMHPYPAGWVTLADRRLDAGELAGADQALENAEGGNPFRLAIVAVPLDLQQGRLNEARDKVEALLAANPKNAENPIVCRLAVAVGRAQGDDLLVAVHEDLAAESMDLRPDPLIIEIQSLAVHELADLQRCVNVAETLPPPQALQVVRSIKNRRPRQSMVLTIEANLLRALGRYPQAKSVLDEIHADDPPDHEYWSLDALVHLELARQNAPELLDRARASIARAIDINPGIAYGWHIQALVHEEDARWADAAVAYRKAAETSSDPAFSTEMLEAATRCESEETRP